jgi:methyltransferase family protein
MHRIVRDDPLDPDPGFAELYASIPDAVDLEPWLGWCRQAAGTVLYLGVGAGRLAVPLAAAGIDLVGVDIHPAMLEHLRVRLPGVEVLQTRIEELHLDRRFPLVIGPSNILPGAERLAAAARHSSHRVAMELMNPYWLLDAEHPTVRVLSATAGNAVIEVDYAGGWTQAAEVPLRWPEDIESFLSGAGLVLEAIFGRDAEADLSDSSTYYVLGRIRRLSTEPTYGAPDLTGTQNLLDR